MIDLFQDQELRFVIVSLTLGGLLIQKRILIWRSFSTIRCTNRIPYGTSCNQPIIVLQNDQLGACSWWVELMQLAQSERLPKMTLRRRKKLLSLIVWLIRLFYRLNRSQNTLRACGQTFQASKPVRFAQTKTNRSSIHQNPDFLDNPRKELFYFLDLSQATTCWHSGKPIPLIETQ